tara:strand:- start:2324 stop:2848 length:525 start_codon:yes stop_codon:yes gene_type:complete
MKEDSRVKIVTIPIHTDIDTSELLDIMIGSRGTIIEWIDQQYTGPEEHIEAHINEEDISVEDCKEKQPDMSRFEQVKRLAFGNKYRMIGVRYLGPTNHRGSRVKLYEALHTHVDGSFYSEPGQSVIIPWDYDYNSSLEIAVDYLLGLGFNVQGCVVGHVLVEWGHPHKSIKGDE